MIKIKASDQLRGTIVLPASKSISARALIINALSGNKVLPENLSDSDDTQAMLRALKTSSDSSVGGRTLSGTESLPFGGKRSIDIGAAGTAMRFLTAYLSVTPGEHFITGTERMKHRPIGILVDALRQLGADIAYEGEEGFPPLRIVGKGNLAGGELSVPGNVSSQYISALLMIAPTLKKGLRLTLTGEIASRPYIDMTIAMMRDFGAKVEWISDNEIGVEPGAYSQRSYTIESDWSAASYWYEMVALSPDADAEVELVGLNRDSIQGDSAVREMFRPLGVETTFFDETGQGGRFVRLRHCGKPCKHMELDFKGQPDLAQTLIVCCAMLGTTFRFSGLASLKIKETDRTAALQAELLKLGIVVHEDGDSVVWWDGETRSNSSFMGEETNSLPLGEAWGGAFDTYEDHRMAMAFAPVCLCTGGEIQINNPEVVSKSYPGFWDDLRKVGFKTLSNSPLKEEKQSSTAEGEVNKKSPFKGGLEGFCCGLHEVCEKESLRSALKSDIEYYEDEELDRFRGRTTYSEEEVEEFREVLYTMRTDEVAGWMRSLELRQVSLPNELKDEVLLLIGEETSEQHT